MIWYYCGRYCRRSLRDDDPLPATPIASGLPRYRAATPAGEFVGGGGRGSVETIRAVVWYADIRGFTTNRRYDTGAHRYRASSAIFETLQLHYARAVVKC